MRQCNTMTRLEMGYQQPHILQAARWQGSTEKNGIRVSFRGWARVKYIIIINKVPFFSLDPCMGNGRKFCSGKGRAYELYIQRIMSRKSFC